jgi:acyl dehydratase
MRDFQSNMAKGRARVESLYFEDLVEGQVFISQGRTITESDVVNFAGLSGDFNPIHLDSVASAEGVFGQRVVYGVLGISIVTGLIDRLGLFRSSMGAMLQIDGWRFLRPSFIGDTVHIELTIEAKRLTKAGDRGVVDRRIKLLNQHGEIVQEGIITVLILSRDAVNA